VFRQTPRHIGLARALSKLGYCSRSQAYALIRAGQVSLEGRIKRDPEQPVDLGHDHIQVRGHPIIEQKKVYVMMNKPRGMLTTVSDEQGRDTIYSLLNPSLPWLAPVGRLDKASEGLLLLSNDSEWGARITDPKTHLEKTYHVQINHVADTSLLQALRSGVRDRGDFLHTRRVSLLRSGERNSWLEIVLDQGKNRQIRRMIAYFELQVLRLVRVSIGPLHLGDLAKGTTRSLTTIEKSALDVLTTARGTPVAHPQRGCSQIDP